MTLRNLGWLITATLLIGLAACSSNRLQPAEGTAQANRAIHLATQVANNLQATKVIESAQAEATSEAMANLLAQAEEWPVAIDERFDTNDLNWPTGDGDDPLATIHWDIRDGAYYWQATANDAFVWWATPEMETYASFYLGVDLEQLTGPSDGEAGLVFRLSEGNYYLFEINASRQYGLYRHDQDGWSTLQEWKDSAAIPETGASRLSVIADREFLLLFIDNRYLTTVFDPQLSEGSAGVLAGLSNPGDQGTWQFDNFVLRVQDQAAPEISP